MSESPGFFSTLASIPAEPLSKLARYTQWNGVLYLGIGAVMLFAPASILTAATGTPPEQTGISRLLGMSVGIIGWFYVMGARTGAASFGLATVVDRAAVPFILGGLVIAGQVQVQQVAAFAVLDPLLALGAYLIWRSEAAS